MDEQLIARQSELIQIVETIDSLLGSKEWKVLQEKVFGEAVERTERLLLNEAKDAEVSLQKIYTLQGELLALKRYDLASYAERCKKELDGIKNKINLQ